MLGDLSHNYNTFDDNTKDKIRTKMYNYIVNICNKCIHIGSPTFKSQTGMINLESCASNDSKSLSYCKKNKLIITKENLNIMINALISDLLNPLKRSYLLSSIYTERDDWIFSRDYTYNILQDHFKTHSLKGFGIDGMDAAIIAAGVIIVLTGEMGVITPPVGVNVFVIKGITPDIPLQVIFRGIMPFLLALILFTLTLMAFPKMATFLPNLVSY